MSYTYTHLEDYTQKVFEKTKIYTPNELNLSSIANSLNVHVDFIDGKSQSARLSGCDYIFLDSALNPFERFEVFGHELGHILLHTGNQKRMRADYRVYQEGKANLFALYFCVPTFMLEQLPTSELNKYRISELFGVTVAFSNKRLSQYYRRKLQANNMKQIEI